MPRYKTDTATPETPSDCLRHLAALAQMCRARATPEGAIVWAQAELELASLIERTAAKSATTDHGPSNAAPLDN